MLLAVRAQPFSADSLVYSGRGLWFGYSVKNAHATETTTVDFYDGLSSTGVLIGSVSVPALTSVVVPPGAAAVRTESGLWLDVTAGTPKVVPYYMTQTRLLTGLTVFDDDDRNLDKLGFLRLVTWLDEHGMSLSMPDDGS